MSSEATQIGAYRRIQRSLSALSCAAMKIALC
jgi:hypothetical protein